MYKYFLKLYKNGFFSVLIDTRFISFITIFIRVFIKRLTVTRLPLFLRLLYIIIL